MKLRLLDFLVCPSCQGTLSLNALTTEQVTLTPEWRSRLETMRRTHAGYDPSSATKTIEELYGVEVISGRLTCTSCSTEFPIESGIPRMLPPALRTAVGQMGRGDPLRDDRIDGFMDDIKPVDRDADQELFDSIQKANQSNYGYEWQAFSHDYDQWDVLYKRNYVDEPDAFFSGKLGLDAGCGNARYTIPAVRRGAEMIGVDLSNAIQSAYARSRDVPGYHPLQGDIFNLPFRTNTFDFAQSLGVVHITPDPERAVQSIKRVVVPGGKVFLYVYKSFADEDRFKDGLLRIATLVRHGTVRLPSNVLYYLLYLGVPLMGVLFYYPSAILSKFSSTRSFADRLPYNYEQYGTRKWRDVHMNLFDRFGNPVERRYTGEQMEEWFERAGFAAYRLTRGYGWNVTATKGEHKS
jgi:SAM-dependent methyltransferase/uncharacterized protein YbaR (Trm112 family)